MKKANDLMKSANERHQKNISRMEDKNKRATAAMDSLGKLELEILQSFEAFSDLIEKIQNRPVFTQYTVGNVTIPQYNGETLREASIGANVLLGGVSGLAAGALGGFAASGATTAAVMAFGSASTGTVISSLSGAAATNATLAALGGGALSVGGGGIALGTIILGTTAIGAAILVGGVIFGITGSRLSKKADEAWNQMKNAESKINGICSYLADLEWHANEYIKALSMVNKIYNEHAYDLRKIIIYDQKSDWNEFSPAEKLITENAVLIVGLLYKMCKVNLVVKSTNKNGLNKINRDAINKSINEANDFIKEKGL